jgi:prolipoprotein diacylglyceryltransferase
VAALLDAPVSRWLHVAIRPLLLMLALGKLGQVLGGTGQGAFVLDGSVPTTAYLGNWAWGSLGPEIPAIPSQFYEGLITLVVLLVVGLLGAYTGLSRPDGRLFAIGLGLWAFARGLVATTWRDSPATGTLKVEQIICLVVAAIALSAAMAAWAWGRHARTTGVSAAPPAPKPAAQR